MNYSLKDLQIEPKSKNEIDYLNKHNLGIDRLSNGITIIAAPSKMDDSVFAQIEWEFPVGAYNQPAGHVHFFEHFINKEIYELADQNGLYLNAYTSQINISEFVKGTANPKFTDYGIWKILSLIREKLADPLPINQEGIEKEKDVVIDEIRRRARDHDFLAADHFRKTVFAKTNPLRDEPSVGGDADGIRNIKLEDLKKVSQDVLIPDGLLINVYTEGEIENARLVSRELKRLFEDFPRSEAKHQEIPRELRELINPEFKPGMVSLVNTKLNNGIITTNFVWVVDRKFPDVTYFALKDLSAILDTRLFEHSRKEGWGYHTSVQISTMADNKSALVLRVDTGKKENIEEYANNVLKKAIIEDILPVSRERLELANKLELLRQKAVPLSNKSRLDWMVEGIKDYGKIFDADKVRKIIEQVQAKDLQYWVNLLINTPPAILITGDLE